MSRIEMLRCPKCKSIRYNEFNSDHKFCDTAIMVMTTECFCLECGQTWIYKEIFEVKEAKNIVVEVEND